MDLSKAFDTINHNLFQSLLKAYGFNENSVSFIRSFITNSERKLAVIEVTGTKLLLGFLGVYYYYFCSYHVTYAFQSESTLCSCLNVKELLARSRREI